LKSKRLRQHSSIPGPICCENCWDFIPNLFKRPDNTLLVITGAMCIAHRHCNVFMVH
jgi:hypothetical protein